MSTATVSAKQYAKVAKRLQPFPLFIPVVNFKPENSVCFLRPAELNRRITEVQQQWNDQERERRRVAGLKASNLLLKLLRQ